MKQTRCAIYTRKSSEEGLQQDFNSLDAQREACSAYILSQASEGWAEIPDRYDDGGLSGGTLERPGLKRLLADVADGKIDIIVVYKVDRLTRSLLDFSRLVESFDKAGTSFVSVTQSFNTTTSMGRLTLNMLLSFAQFEREVTAERIRDKIAASKARGMWMGGIPPLGYEPDERSLKVVEPHAAMVRDIFDRYLRLGNVRRVAEELAEEGIVSPVRIKAKSGAEFGGVPFSRGQIYGILKCPTYVGEVHHRGCAYAGLHKGIINREIWDRTQAMLVSNLNGDRTGARAANPSLLAGKVVDAEDRPLIPVHATKGKTRYRYYVSRDLHEGKAGTGLRIPAVELETAVRERIGAIFDDGFALATADWLQVSPADYVALMERCLDVAGRGRAMLQDVVQQVRICDSRIEIDCSTAAIAQALGVQRDDDATDTHTVISDVRLTRSGRAMRLIQGNGAPIAGSPDASLIRLIIKARRWWARLREGEVDIKTLGKMEGVQPAYITRVVRLAFLAPSVVDVILAGATLPGIDSTFLTLRHALAPDWSDQKIAMLPEAARR
jgi:DNA invertase Pin-like site-specific DNA recombinase